MSTLLRDILARALSPVTDATWSRGNRFSPLAESIDDAEGNPFVLRWLDHDGPWQRHYWIAHPGTGSTFLVYMDLWHEDGDHYAAFILHERPDGHLDILRAESYYNDILPEDNEHYIGPEVVYTGPDTADIIDSLEWLFPGITNDGFYMALCHPRQGVAGFGDVVRYFRHPDMWSQDIVASYTQRVILRYRYGNPDPCARLRLKAGAHPWARAYDALQRQYTRGVDRTLFGNEYAAAIQRAWRRSRIPVRLARFMTLRDVCHAFGCRSRGVRGLIAEWL